jgi:hypothetical protein
MMAKAQHWTDSLQRADLFYLLGNDDAAKECERAEASNERAMKALEIAKAALSGNANGPLKLSRKTRDAMLIMYDRSDELLTDNDFEFHAPNRKLSMARSTIGRIRPKLISAGYALQPEGRRKGITLTDRGREIAAKISNASKK